MLQRISLIKRDSLLFLHKLQVCVSYTFCQINGPRFIVSARLVLSCFFLQNIADQIGRNPAGLTEADSGFKCH